MTNCFEKLGLRTNATVDEVKARWKELAFKYHPDHNAEPTAAETFQDLNRAYIEALAEAEKPKACERCAGTGKATIRKGFFSMPITCTACAGTGKIKN